MIFMGKVFEFSVNERLKHSFRVKIEVVGGYYFHFYPLVFKIRRRGAVSVDVSEEYPPDTVLMKNVHYGSAHKIPENRRKMQENIYHAVVLFAYFLSHIKRAFQPSALTGDNFLVVRVEYLPLQLRLDVPPAG